MSRFSSQGGPVDAIGLARAGLAPEEPVGSVGRYPYSADLAAISRQLGHTNVGITLSTYTHFFAKRTEAETDPVH